MNALRSIREHTLQITVAKTTLGVDEPVPRTSGEQLQPGAYRDRHAAAGQCRGRRAKRQAGVRWYEGLQRS